MKILQVVQELAVGGAEKLMLSLAEQALADGHEVAVAAATGPLRPSADVALYPLPRVERRPHRLPAAALAIRSSVRDFKPDVVHCHNPTMAVAAALAGCGRIGPPALTTCHGVPYGDYRATARLLRASGLKVVACGPGVQRALMENGLREVDLIVNGIAESAADVSPASARSADPGILNAIIVGRLTDQKRPWIAVEAMMDVADVHLTVVGEGPLRGRLEEMSETAGLRDRIRFMGRRDDARALIADADVLVLPSEWEGLPLVALEALAEGTPVVAADVVGIRELFDDQVNALLFDGSPADLGRQFRRLLDEPDLGARLARAGSDLSKTHTLRDMYRSYAQAYGVLTSRR